MIDPAVHWKISDFIYQIEVGDFPDISRDCLTRHVSVVLALFLMRLTRFTDNALRCLMVLGLEPEACIPVHTIAVRMNMSHEHLVKIVQRLAELGYVETVRGRNGGVRLAMPATAIALGALVRKMEDNLALVECFDPEHNTCPIAPACVLAGMLDEALSAFLTVLDGYSLADALRPGRQLTVLMRAMPVPSPVLSPALPSALSAEDP